MKKYKVLFCDLDGTLINTISGNTFPKGIWDMTFRFKVLDAIKKLAPEHVFIVSNQGGIEKGFVDILYFQQKLIYVELAIREYIKNNEVYSSFCIYNDKNCNERKPNTGMLDKFWRTIPYFIKKEDCLMIGDASGLEGHFSDSDKKTAENFDIDYMDVHEFVETYNK